MATPEAPEDGGAYLPFTRDGSLALLRMFRRIVDRRVLMSIKIHRRCAIYVSYLPTDEVTKANNDLASSAEYRHRPIESFSHR